MSSISTNEAFLLVINLLLLLKLIVTGEILISMPYFKKQITNNFTK